MYPLLDKRGMSIAFAVFMLLLMSIVGASIFSLTSGGSGGAAAGISKARARAMAEAGLQLAAERIWYEVNYTLTGFNPSNPQVSGYTPQIYIEGYQAQGPSGASRTSFSGRHYTDTYVGYNSSVRMQGPGTTVTMGEFRQKRNLIGTRILDFEIVMRASMMGTPYAQVYLEYSTDGGQSWITPVGWYFTIRNYGWGTNSYYSREIDFSPQDWSSFMDNNFMIRARLYNNATFLLDWLCIRAKVEVDRMPSASISFNNGDNTNITISDESAKIHLNYAARELLENLGMSTSTVTDIINYRMGTGPFETLEELKKPVSEGGIGMSETDYNQFKDYLTVYSWVNQDTTRPTGPRAPININTASLEVLEAVFKCMNLTTTEIDSLVSSIVSQRDTTPFTHMGSSYANQRELVESFSGFIEGRYLTDAKKNEIRSLADAALYNRGSTTDPDVEWTGATSQPATEFCYYTNTYLITSEGVSDGVKCTIKATCGNLYDYNNYAIDNNSSFILPAHIEYTYVGDDRPKRYWREER